MMISKMAPNVYCCDCLLILAVIETSNYTLLLFSLSNFYFFMNNYNKKLG